MVLLYQPSAKAKNHKKSQSLIAEIIDLDYQGLGVAKIQGKTWFVENTLPQEKVELQIEQEKRQYGLATVKKWLSQNPQRQTPRCGYYGRCGGCQNQHIPLAMQREAKQKALFQRLSKLQPEPIQFMPMIVGDAWHYRRRVRLSVQFNEKNRQLEIGFRQKNSNQIVSIEQCPVAKPVLNALLPKLRPLLSQWKNPKQIGHIELVAADNGVAMLFRFIGELKNFPENDRSLLQNFAVSENLMLFVQDNQEIVPFQSQQPVYRLNDGCELQFDIKDFIQVNAELNKKMVATALDWLDLQSQDCILDLFCGMGNFTLPLSRLVQNVVGIEGVQPMVQKAKQNAERNQLTNVEFYQADLDQPFANQNWAKRPFNKILLDPPRSGAAFALNALCELNAEKILYVSCNPATLVRDAEILRNFGYRIQQTAMIDMFPHTGHLESITLFIKE